MTEDGDLVSSGISCKLLNCFDLSSEVGTEEASEEVHFDHSSVEAVIELDEDVPAIETVSIAEN